MFDLSYVEVIHEQNDFCAMENQNDAKMLR